MLQTKSMIFLKFAEICLSTFEDNISIISSDSWFLVYQIYWWRVSIAVDLFWPLQMYRCSNVQVWETCQGSGRCGFSCWGQGLGCHVPSSQGESWTPKVQRLGSMAKHQDWTVDRQLLDLRLASRHADQITFSILCYFLLLAHATDYLTSLHCLQLMSTASDIKWSKPGATWWSFSPRRCTKSQSCRSCTWRSLKEWNRWKASFRCTDALTSGNKVSCNINESPREFLVFWTFFRVWTPQYFTEHLVAIYV
jgi:hypothetical protein